MTEKPNLRWRIRQSHLPPPEQAMVELLQTTVPLSHVVPTDYVVERLVYGLLERNPASLDWLNRHGGDHSMRLANVLMDWRDTWGESP